MSLGKEGCGFVISLYVSMQQCRLGVTVKNPQVFVNVTVDLASVS